MELPEIIEKLSRSMQEHEAKVIAGSRFSKLTLTQIHYLDAIRHLSKPTVTQLAKCLKVAKPTVTVALDKLEHLGFVCKIQDQKDKRIQSVLLTSKGLTISELHDSIHLSYAQYFLKVLKPQEVHKLTQLLSLVIEKLP